MILVSLLIENTSSLNCKVNLGQLVNVTAIETQGKSGQSEWVKSYTIAYTAKDNVDYQDYVENGGVAKVKGNSV